MAKHTPGPWEAQRYSVTLSRSSEAWHVCECHHGLGHDDYEALANARLIAAAPELLEAARQFLVLEEGPLPTNPVDDADYIERQRGAVAVAKTAYAKAISS